MKRISIVVLILCGCFVSVAWGQQPAGTCFNNWSEFHRTNMERWNPCEKVLGVNNVGNLSLKWSYTTNLDITSVAVANGVVYVGANQNVYALKASTGAKLWSYRIIGVVDDSPAVANGVVYVSTGTRVLALKASTGAKLWSDSINSTHKNPTSLSVANGVVYFASVNYVGPNVFALNAKTGALRWSYATGTRGATSPVVANGMLYGSSGPTVYALNASTGALLWSYATGGGR
jgi:outer membrane protein assembly factor BamB